MGKVISFNAVIGLGLIPVAGRAYYLAEENEEIAVGWFLHPIKGHKVYSVDYPGICPTHQDAPFNFESARNLKPESWQEVTKMTAKRIWDSNLAFLAIEGVHKKEVAWLFKFDSGTVAQESANIDKSKLVNSLLGEDANYAYRFWGYFPF